MVLSLIWLIREILWYFQAGANLNLSRYEQSNALCMATVYQLTTLVQYFLYNGADQNSECKLL